MLNSISKYYIYMVALFSCSSPSSAYYLFLSAATYPLFYASKILIIREIDILR
jgi:hypothetical protein